VIRIKDDFITLKEEQIKDQKELLHNKENNMTEIIKNLESQLALAEGQNKINAELLLNQSGNIIDLREQIRMKETEIKTKSFQVEDQSNQISSKDLEIRNLNNKI